MSLEATIAENTAALRDLIAAIGKGIPTTHAQVAAVVAEAKPEATAKKPDGAAQTAETKPTATTAAAESSQSVAAETGMTAAQATATRPAYAASGGYSGSQFLAALSKRFPTYWVGGYVRYDNLQGAAFDDSPLVARNHYLAGGVAVAWIFGESSQRVSVDD